MAGLLGSGSYYISVTYELYYVLPHDSNKLDNINLGLLSQKGFFDSDLEEKQILLSDAMSYVHADITAPRYYLAATRKKNEENSKDESLKYVD